MGIRLSLPFSPPTVRGKKVVILSMSKDYLDDIISVLQNHPRRALVPEHDTASLSSPYILDRSTNSMALEWSSNLTFCTYPLTHLGTDYHEFIFHECAGLVIILDTSNYDCQAKIPDGIVELHNVLNSGKSKMATIPAFVILHSPHNAKQPALTEERMKRCFEIGGTGWGQRPWVVEKTDGNFQCGDDIHFAITHLIDFMTTNVIQNLDNDNPQSN